MPTPPPPPPASSPRRPPSPACQRSLPCLTIPWMDELAPEVEALRRVPFFEGLTPEDLSRIATIGERRSFEAGQAIVSKSDVGGGLFVILSSSATVAAGGNAERHRPGGITREMARL